MTDTNIIPVNKPTAIEYGINHNVFKWPEHELIVEVDRITEDGKAELYFYHSNGKGKVLMHMGDANLMSSRMQSEFVKALNTRMSPSIDWQTVLTAIARLTMQHLRQGEPPALIAGPPQTQKLHYQIWPIIESNQPTTIYAPGASGKSYMADLFATMVQFGFNLTLSHFSWQAKQGNVLYLDWESSQRDHERRLWAIKQGLGLDEADANGSLYYRYCTMPLVTDIANVQKIVFDNEISLVIVDSQMAASGYGIDAAQLASHYYNALKSLECTTLTIDHVSKEEWKGLSDVAPFGSVVKYNRARSLFQMQKKQYSGEPYIDIALQHKKHNEGMLLSPTGLRINFNNDSEQPDILLSVKFNSIDPEDVIKGSDLEKDTRPQHIKDQIAELLEDGGLTIREIAEQLKQKDATIRSIISRYNGSNPKNKIMFSKNADGKDGQDVWELADTESI